MLIQLIMKTRVAVLTINHQQSVHKLACLLKIVHNVLNPYISERSDLPFPKFSK